MGNHAVIVPQFHPQRLLPRRLLVDTPTTGAITSSILAQLYRSLQAQGRGRIELSPRGGMDLQGDIQAGTGENVIRSARRCHRQM
jgi:hypothetical protein